MALVTATGTVMLPHVANAVSKGNMREVNRMLYKSFDFVSAISYPMMFGLAAISLTLTPKYYGPGYNPVGPAMMIESIVILMIAWSNVLGVQYLLSGIIMFVPVFWMNQHLKDSWPMMGLEVIVGVIIYSIMVMLLKAPVVDQAKELIINRFKK